MGSRFSTSKNGEKHEHFDSGKGFLRFSITRKAKRRVRLEEEAQEILLRKSIYATSLTATARENEISEERYFAAQRKLPSIPGSEKENDSDQIEPIYESAPTLTGLGQTVCDAESRSNDASELCAKSNSHCVYNFNDRGTKARASDDAEKEDPDRRLCPETESVRCCECAKPVAVVLRSTSADPNNWAATATEDVYTSVNQDLASDVTYMQINGSDETYVKRTVYSENVCAPEAGMDNVEIEDTPVNQVPIGGNDYVRTDFNVNAVEATTQTRNTLQAIVGPALGPRVHAGVVLYPVKPGAKLTLSEATVEVPISAGQDPPPECVEVGWNNSSAEFPVLASDQRPLTKVLHCLPHGSTFNLPVVISVNLPVIEGQVEIFYSPTDVGQLPVWTKLRVIDTPDNTRFTDDNRLYRNFVTLDRHRSIARFELRHFCAFFIVENGRVIEIRKAKASILLKTDFGRDWCSVNIRVVLGCLEDVALQKMMEKVRTYASNGFQMLDDMELGIVAGESESSVSIKISKIQWMPYGQITNGDVDPQTFQLHHLWNHGSVGAMFWQRSQITNGMKPETFAATVHIQQDDRQDVQNKILCPLEKVLPFNKQQHSPADDYTIIKCSDKPAKDPHRCEPLGVTAKAAALYPSSFCYEDLVDLHSNSSEPEAKATAAAENLDLQKKAIETAL